MADPIPDGRYDSEALVDLAEAAGLSASARLIRDWSQLGLMDQPERRGLGRGRGTTATWSANQGQLFLQMLVQRDRGASIAGLCNLPVWLWLWFGEDFVPIRQVRRALRTWSEAALRPTWSGASAAAAAVTGKIAHPNAKRATRRRLRAELEAEQAEGVEPAGLLAAARAVIDPFGEERPRGPAGAPLSPEAYVDLLRARQLAVSELPRLTELEYVAAGGIYRATKSQYEADRATFAQDPDTGHLFAAGGLEEQINGACVDLLQVLGFEKMNMSNVHGAGPVR